MKTNTQTFLWCLLLSGTLVAPATYAEDVNFGKKVPSSTEIIKALSPEEEQGSSNQETDNPGNQEATEGEDGTRSIPGLKPVMSPAKKPVYQYHPKKPIKPKADRRVALSIQLVFDYNSPRLTESAKAQLKPVGEAMNSDKLKNLNFTVEGHTDAVGSETYNYKLSKERADSVKNFLVDNFAIQATRIETLGKGKHDLLDRSHPDSEVNRRVRILVR